MSALTFEITGAYANPSSAVPMVSFRLRVRSASRVDAIALRAQIKIQTRRRHYNGDEELDLVDLFGEPGRWGETLHPLLWAHVDTTIPGFDRETDVDLHVPCSYDFEVAGNKYLAALEDGIVPLLFLFSGTIFSAGERGLEVSRVPWELEAPFALPVATYRAAMESHFPNTGWIRMRADLFDEMNRYKSAGCFPSWDRAIEALLDAARERR